MSDFTSIYTTFNWLEGAVWLAVAILLPFLFQHPTRTKRWAIGVACAGLVGFGISDFIEVSIPGGIPWWLWTLKIACVALMLGGRFAYVGWRQFRWSDRYFLLGLLGLAAVLAIAWMPW